MTMDDGSVMTVLGPVAADRLGRTLMHEHLLFNLETYLHQPLNPEDAPLVEAPLTLDTLEEWGLPIGGVYVSSVTPNTPAAEAGLVGSINRGGDYITAVDGMPIRDSGELIAYLVFETAVGQTIELTVIRDGQEAVVPLTLGARP